MSGIRVLSNKAMAYKSARDDPLAIRVTKQSPTLPALSAVSPVIISKAMQESKGAEPLSTVMNRSSNLPTRSRHTKRPKEMVERSIIFQSSLPLSRERRHIQAAKAVKRAVARVERAGRAGLVRLAETGATSNLGGQARTTNSPCASMPLRVSTLTLKVAWKAGGSVSAKTKTKQKWSLASAREGEQQQLGAKVDRKAANDIPIGMAKRRLRLRGQEP